MKNLKVVNILGEPGAGKSSTAKGLAFLLGRKGKDTEIVAEVAKDFVFEANIDPQDKSRIISPYILNDQLFLFGEQNRRLERLRGKMDYAILDCPLVMSILYQRENYYPSFEPLVLDVIKSYDNINIFLERTHQYKQVGRVQNEQESLEMRKILLSIMDKYSLPYTIFKTHDLLHEEIAEYLLSIEKK